MARSTSRVDQDGAALESGAKSYKVASMNTSYYLAIPDLKDDAVVGNWVGGLQRGGVMAMGVLVTLTRKRLILTPLDLGKAFQILDFMSNFAKTFKVPLKVIKDGVEPFELQKVVDIPVTEIVTAKAVGNSSLFTPPMVYLKLKDGKEIRLGVLAGVLAGVLSPNINPKNVEHRDQFVEALETLLN